MALKSNLYGLKAQVIQFPGVWLNSTLASSIRDFIDQNTYTVIGTIDYCIAKISNRSAYPGGSNLYNGTTFNAGVAVDLDTAIPGWQIQPINIFNINYTGTVPQEASEGLYANRSNLLQDNYLNGTLMIKISDYFFIVLYNYSGDHTHFQFNPYLYNRYTNTSFEWGANIIKYEGTTITEAKAYYDPSNGMFYSTYNLTNGSSDVKNKMRVPNLGTARSIPGLIDIFTPDYNPEHTDPYSPGGESGTGGGTGTFDGTSTPIPIPGLPSLSAVDTGFITLFNPSLAQLKNLASYMWSGTFDLNTFKKLFADPMDCILGLSIVPVAVPNGGNQSVMVGNISTGVSMTLAGSQYVVVNCGTINVNEYWGSYLDYAPYSKASIYLPYCGVHPIDIDEIMDRSITVEYHVDILSGACVAFIMCADSVLYSFTGQCASSIPVSGNDFTQMINGIITASTAIGSMVATGGATAPVAVPQLVSTAVNSMKPEVEKSGSLSGTGGMLAIQTPYLILTIPRQALPKDQNTFTGYPSFITSNLGDLSGYTEVEEIHLESIPATDGELSEILNLLKSGVIL